jgi:hypothetical protein
MFFFTVGPRSGRRKVIFKNTNYPTDDRKPYSQLQKNKGSIAQKESIGVTVVRKVGEGVGGQLIATLNGGGVKPCEKRCCQNGIVGVRNKLFITSLDFPTM